MTWYGALRKASTKGGPCRRRTEVLCHLLAGAGAYRKEMDSDDLFWENRSGQNGRHLETGIC